MLEWSTVDVQIVSRSYFSREPRSFSSNDTDPLSFTGKYNFPSNTAGLCTWTDRTRLTGRLRPRGGVCRILRSKRSSGSHDWFPRHISMGSESGWVPVGGRVDRWKGEVCRCLASLGGDGEEGLVPEGRRWTWGIEGWTQADFGSSDIYFIDVKL